MIGRYYASLNTISLESINPCILIYDISYDAPSRNRQSYTLVKREGATIYSSVKEKASCTISFFIREPDIAKRQRICQSVCAWARNGGELCTNDRKDQKLVCICEKLPAITSALKWTEPLSITFTAYSQPYWQEVFPSTLTLSGTSGNGKLFIPGSAPETMVEISATARASLPSISFTVGSYTISLSGLSVTSGQVIKITYDNQMIQSIKVGNTSLLNKRTGADDLKAQCGTSNNISFSASANTTVVFSARGLWE